MVQAKSKSSKSQHIAVTTATSHSLHDSAATVLVDLNHLHLNWDLAVTALQERHQRISATAGTVRQAVLVRLKQYKAFELSANDINTALHLLKRGPVALHHLDHNQVCSILTLIAYAATRA